MNIKNWLEDAYVDANGRPTDYTAMTDRLRSLLNRLPLTRESAVEIVEAARWFDIFELYEALFSRFFPFLTNEERQESIRRFKKVFTIPLSELGVSDDGEGRNVADEHA